MIKVTQISKKDLIPNQWDGGLTYEYFIFPQNNKYINRNFAFRISSATIEKVPSNFTQFDGYFRYLVMLDNSLSVIRNKNIECYTKHQVFKFKSNEKIISNSLGKDFNLMISNRILKHELDFFVGEKTINSDWIILFSLSKTFISINQDEKILMTNDCIIIENINKLDVKINTSTNIIIATLSF